MYNCDNIHHMPKVPFYSVPFYFPGRPRTSCPYLMPNIFYCVLTLTDPRELPQGIFSRDNLGSVCVRGISPRMFNTRRGRWSIGPWCMTQKGGASFFLFWLVFRPPITRFRTRLRPRRCDWQTGAGGTVSSCKKNWTSLFTTSGSRKLKIQTNNTKNTNSTSPDVLDRPLKTTHDEVASSH